MQPEFGRLKHRYDRSVSPTASAAGSQEGLASPERERRQALEYGEDDLPAQDIPGEVREAEVSFPNLPVPRSSDGDVSTAIPNAFIA
jgi:RNA polymerase-associated protein LEO1